MEKRNLCCSKKLLRNGVTKKIQENNGFFFKILKCNKNWIYYSRKWKVLETFFLLVFMSKKEDSKFFFLFVGLIHTHRLPHKTSHYLSVSVCIWTDVNPIINSPEFYQYQCMFFSPAILITRFWSMSCLDYQKSIY